MNWMARAVLAMAASSISRVGLSMYWRARPLVWTARSFMASVGFSMRAMTYGLFRIIFMYFSVSIERFLFFIYYNTWTQGSAHT